MPGFDKGPAFRVPFGNNAFLGSTRDFKLEHRTFAKSTVPTVEIDGVDCKVLPKGAVLALITSGADAGKVGVRDADASDGRQTVGNIVGVNNTFLPTQLLHRDVEVAFVYDGVVVGEWLLEYDGSPGEWVAATTTTKNALRPNTAPLDVTVTFRTPSDVVVDNTNTI